MLINKKNFTGNNLINLLISLIPLTLILGNLATNINIILICISGIMIYKLEIFKINLQKYQYLIYLFFLYLILITTYQNVTILSENDLYKVHIIKSLLFLRFLIFFLVIIKLFEKNHFNVKFFYISCSVFALIISTDILLQSILGKNLLGQTTNYSHHSSFFGSENIAGGYLQKFSFLFVVFFTTYYIKHKNNLYSLLLFSIFFIPMVLTGNRMPLILYCTCVVAFYIFQKKIKELTIFLFVCLAFIFCLLKYFDYTKKGDEIIHSNFIDKPLFYINVNLRNFYNSSKIILIRSKDLLLNNEEAIIINQPDQDEYILHFNTGIEIWKQNKIIGNGLKSFRLKCSYDPGQTCNTHPHNYTIEIMVDTGLIGVSLIYLIFIFCFFDFLKFYLKNQNLNLKLISLPFFLITCLEFFPIRSTGSFFTTSNAVIIFFMLAVTIGFSNYKKN